MRVSAVLKGKDVELLWHAVKWYVQVKIMETVTNHQSSLFIYFMF